MGKLTAIMVLACLILVAAPPARANSSEVLQASLLPSANSFAQGGTYPMAIRLTVKPGMHINANQPNDPDIIPTKIQLTASGGLGLGPASYPPAKTIKLGFAEKPLAVFDGAVLVRTTLQVAGDAKLGDHQVTAKISFQGCDDNMCFMPETQEVVLKVKVVPAGQKVLPLNRDVFAR